MEHEERPKVLNELGKKIQLLMKAVEAYKNKVEANQGMNYYGCVFGCKIIFRAAKEILFR